MKMRRLLSKPPTTGPLRAGLGIVLVCFLLGLVLGRGAQLFITPMDDEQLRTYILYYAQLSAGQPEDRTAWLLSALTVYFRYPVAAFVLGFTAVGIVLVPALCVVQGFFLAFSISCFVSAMGSGGAALAFFAFGVRCLFTLPCTFLLSAWSVASAIQLLQKKTKGTGRDRRIYDSAYFFRFFMCVLVLLVGLAAEITLVPKLVQLVLPDMM